MSGPEFNPQDDMPIDRAERERAMIDPVPVEQPKQETARDEEFFSLCRTYRSSFDPALTIRAYEALKSWVASQLASQKEEIARLTQERDQAIRSKLAAVCKAEAAEAERDRLRERYIHAVGCMNRSCIQCSAWAKEIDQLAAPKEG